MDRPTRYTRYMSASRGEKWHTDKRVSYLHLLLLGLE
ncbi:hypothetical protein LMG31841_00299 [Paraburkholderia saeva]|uniref:Uncharacterized protein n=1 Tax=Paraburkholderia saeva TaxID=2777537 RepID=A0A9N8RST4_9BURK|nr:hypothetical protein LMG31841_00299 [Paraburkholderia saeva]